MMTTETKRKYSALEQCRALLLVWSERRTPTEVSRELKISGGCWRYGRSGPWKGC